MYAYTMLGSTPNMLQPKDFKTVDSTDLGDILDYLHKNNLLPQSVDSTEAQNKLRELWNMGIESIGGGSISSRNKRIDILYQNLRVWATKYIGDNKAPANVDSFITDNLGWCDQWRQNTETNQDCSGIGATNFNYFRYHLIYSFIRLQMPITTPTPTPTSPSPTVPIPPSIQDLQKNLDSLNKEIETYKFIVLSAIGISLLITLLSLLYGFSNRKKIKKIAKVTKASKTTSPAPSKSFQEKVKGNLEQKVIGLENRIRTLELRNTSEMGFNNPREVGYSKTKTDSEKIEVNYAKPEAFSKVVYFAEQPNPQGVIAKTHGEETNKSYFIISLRDDHSQTGEITLVDNTAKRKKLFNTPDTYLSSSICDLQYAGQIDYSSRVDIQPGEVQKMPNGAWKVTKPMVVSLR